MRVAGGPRPSYAFGPRFDRRMPGRSFCLTVPELTRGGDIKPNARVSLRRLVVAVSFAYDARTPFQCCLNDRLGRGGGGLALVPARLCRMDFQALTVCPESIPPQSQSTRAPV